MSTETTVARAKLQELSAATKSHVHSGEIGRIGAIARTNAVLDYVHVSDVVASACSARMAAWEITLKANLAMLTNVRDGLDGVHLVDVQ